MAKLSIGGEILEIRPLKLGDIEVVAPYLDAIQEELGAPKASMVGSTAVYKLMLKVFAQGLDGIAADELSAKGTWEDTPDFWITYREVQEEAGMLPKGEPKPPAGGQDQSAPQESTPAG